MNRIALLIVAICTIYLSHAQCAMCTKTASQLGDKPAEGINAGILYIMFIPLIIILVIGYKWWRRREQS